MDKTQAGVLRFSIQDKSIEAEMTLLLFVQCSMSQRWAEQGAVEGCHRQAPASPALLGPGLTDADALPMHATFELPVEFDASGQRWKALITQANFANCSKNV